MLSMADNELLTRTGPGTPAGKFLRSFWQPIATSDELPPGGDPVPVRVMSEDLVLFRDDKDRLGLIGASCPHRGTDLSYGRVEDGGLRCLYHGWLFDIDGRCIDQPAEKTGRSFCDRVRNVAYPVQEKGGVIWTFMGEGEAPVLPDYEFLVAPEPNRLAFRVVQTCNWLQGLESVLDPVHTTYLHRRKVGTTSIRSGQDLRAVRGVEPPDLAMEKTRYGMRIYALHDAPNGQKYLRVNNFLWPCGATPSTSTGTGGYQGRWYVPRDDFSHHGFEFFFRRAEPLDKDVLRNFRAENVAPDGRHVRRPENRYMQDRAEMKRGDTFCGMGEYFPAQDAFAIETQGAIRDRMREHLGASDVVIASVTRMLLDAVRQVAAGKEASGRFVGPEDRTFDDFICTAVHVDDNEDGPGYCRRALANQAAE